MTGSGSSFGCCDLAAVRRTALRLIRLEPIAAEIRATRARSLTGIAARLNQRGVPAILGGAWSAEQVKRVLAQVDAAHRALGCEPGRKRGRPRKVPPLPAPPDPRDLL